MKQFASVLFVLIISTVSWALTINHAQSAVLLDCQNLAIHYVENSKSLAISDLNRLEQCIAKERLERTFNSGNNPKIDNITSSSDSILNDELCLDKNEIDGKPKFCMNEQSMKRSGQHFNFKTHFQIRENYILKDLFPPRKYEFLNGTPLHFQRNFPVEPWDIFDGVPFSFNMNTDTNLYFADDQSIGISKRYSSSTVISIGRPDSILDDDLVLSERQFLKLLTKEGHFMELRDGESEGLFWEFPTKEGHFVEIRDGRLVESYSLFFDVNF